MATNILGRIEDGTTTEIDERFMSAHTEFQANLGALSNVNLQLNDVREPTESMVLALEELNAVIEESRGRVNAVL